ncbi:MAG: hypothetical protein AB7Q97_18965 [Gammaproteobacteria bacterium]
MNGAGRDLDLASMRQLRVQPTTVSNVWRVLLPLQPWRFENAQLERQSIVGKLSTALPYRALWLSDWANENAAGWCFLTRNQTLSSLADDLANGAWALFFFDHDPTSSFDTTLIPAEPTDATVAMDVLRNLRASAAIWSWYDDNDWLVVMPANEPEER